MFGEDAENENLLYWQKRRNGERPLNIYYYMLARRSHYLDQTCKRDRRSSLQVFPSNMKIKLVVFYMIFLLAFAFPFVPLITSGETHKCPTVKVGLAGSRYALNKLFHSKLTQPGDADLC